MADIIHLADRLKAGSNIIVSRPLEFRRAEWLSGSAVLCTREDSERIEAHRQKQARGSEGHFISLVPDHFTLEGGCHFTALYLFRFRKTEESMRRVYRLAGLMECITKAPSPILRTDLVRKFFKLIVQERGIAAAEFNIAPQRVEQEFWIHARVIAHINGRLGQLNLRHSFQD